MKKPKATGESHIVVTDKNGQFSTASDWASHKKNTNAGKSSEDGIWFGTSKPDDSKGALLYDTYEIEELACESNKGMKLIPAFEVVVSRNKVKIDLGTLTDTGKLKEFIDYCKSHSLPDTKISFDKTSVNAYVRDGIQVTDWITFKGNKNNSISIQVPKNVTLHYSNGSSVTNNKAVVKGGQKFYL